jgi:hypothetical protein
MHGRDLRPARWCEQLEMRDLIERVARDLWTVCVDGGDVDDEAYPRS